MLKDQLASKHERIATLEEAKINHGGEKRILFKKIEAGEKRMVFKDYQLRSKDERIASLEERLVKMSVELESLKAFEDEHRANKH